MSRESKGRKDPAYSRRDTEAQRKSSSSGGSSDYSQSSARGLELEASGELPKDQPGDTDQEFELICINQEPGLDEEDRPTLDPVTADLLDTLQ